MRRRSNPDELSTGWVVYIRGELWVNEDTGKPWAFPRVDIAQQIAEQVFGRRAGIRVVYVGGR